MGKVRVVIQRTRNGFVVRSFDFTVNIFERFEGEGALTRAIEHCTIKDYRILSASKGAPVITEQEERQPVEP